MMRAAHLGTLPTPKDARLVLQPHLSHRDEGSLMYGARDSESYLSEVKDLAQNDKLNDTLFISAVVVLENKK